MIASDEYSNHCYNAILHWYSSNDIILKFNYLFTRRLEQVYVMHNNVVKAFPICYCLLEKHCLGNRWLNIRTNLLLKVRGTLCDDYLKPLASLYNMHYCPYLISVDLTYFLAQVVILLLQC